MWLKVQTLRLNWARVFSLRDLVVSRKVYMVLQLMARALGSRARLGISLWYLLAVHD